MPLKLFWYKAKNFGDMLNPWLVQKLTGETPKFSKKDPEHAAIGSVLHLIPRKPMQIWGTGSIRARLPNMHPKLKVHATRGPETAALLRAHGIKCPAVYGDPAIILPRVYAPVPSHKCGLGIIPHYVDSNHPVVLKLSRLSGVKCINIREPVEDVINQICACDAVISSALHGLIVAQAYGVPSLWVEFSDKVLGGGFKFRDYLRGICVKPYKPLNLRNNHPNVNQLIEMTRDDRPPNKVVDALLEACPFPIWGQ